MNTQKNSVIEHFNTLLQQTLNQIPMPSSRLKAAIDYAVFPGGKRLRPRLVYACGRLLSSITPVLNAIAIAVELIHCYSLVHDDLPAMDNDDFRRGRLSCHREFDEATAILAGDGLQPLATEILLRQLTPHLPASVVIEIVTELMMACGPSGMVSGQCLDLTELTQQALTLNQVTQIHQLKTARFFSACINMVILSASGTPYTAERLQGFAHHFGLVFQMQDDYLDRFSAQETLGKFRSSDQSNQKKTFATFYDQTQLFNLIQKHFTTARHTLVDFGENANDLLHLIDELQDQLSEHAP